MHDVPTAFDPANLTPDDLVSLPESQFRVVVDADLRRRVRPEGLPVEVSDALRTPLHAPRWHAILSTMARSVEGQLTARTDDYSITRLDLQTQIDRLPANDPARSELVTQLRETEATFLKWKAGIERFKSGLDQHLITAVSIMADSDGERRDTILLADARQRVRELELAIARHREAATASLDGEDPYDYEIELWKALEAR